MSWGMLIAVVGLPIALGHGIDAWISIRQRQALHARMSQWYRKLYATPFPDLYRGVAMESLGFLQRLSGKSVVSARFVAASTMLSVALTTLAIMVGNMIQGHPPWAVSLAVPYMYGVNVVFDWTTIVLAVYTLGYLVRCSPVRGAAIAVGYLTVAYLLAICCVFVYLLLTLWTLGSPELDRTGAAVKLTTSFAVTFPAFLKSLLSLDFREYASALPIGTPVPDATVMLFAATSFLPAVIYAVGVATQMVCRLVLYLGKVFAWQWCEVAISDADNDMSRFRPFTILGGAFGILGAILNALG